MARLFSSGFELRSLTSGVEWQTTTGSPTISTTTVNPNGGSASMRCNPSAAAWYVMNTFQADTTNTHYERFYLYIATLPSADTFIWQYLDSGNGIASGIKLTTAGAISAWGLGGTVSLGSSSALTTSAWHRIEIKYTDSTGSTGVLEIYIDGVLFATYTGLAGNSGSGRSRLGVITATTADLYFDDYAVNDTSGTVQNAYPGDGRIIHARPSSAGDNAGWTIGVGSTNWGAVSEQTPDDATSYVQHTTTGAVIDDHRVTVPSFSASAITLVAVGLRGGSTATTTGVNINTRLKSAASGTVQAGTTQAFNVNGWRSFSATPFQYKLTAYVDPTTGVAWTATGTNSLANMQIGYTDTTSNTTVKRVTAVWALIEFVPVAGPQNYTKNLSDSVTSSDSLTKTITHAKAQNFKDDFATDDTVKWPNSYNAAGVMSVSGGRLNLSTKTTTNYVGRVSAFEDYDLTGSYIYVQLYDIGTFKSLTSGELFMIQAYHDSNNRVFWYMDTGGLISCYKTVAGTQTRLVSGGLTYDPAVHKWFRIRESAGTTYFDWATDPNSGWTNFYSMTNVFDMSYLTFEMTVGTYGTETTTATVVFDNFNTNGLAFTAPGSDSVTTSDSMAKAAVLNRADSVAASDALAKAMARATTDAVSATDSILLKRGLIVSLSDSVTSADLRKYAAGLNRSDSVASSDAQTRATTLNRGDATTVSDVVVKKPALNKSDSVTATDSPSNTSGKSVNMADSVTTSDSARRNVAKATSDIATTADAMNRAAAYNRSVADSVASSDSSIRKPVLQRSDSTVSSDSRISKSTLNRADTAASSDAISKKPVLPRSDSVTATDSSFRRFVKNLADSVVAIDLAPRTSTYHLALTDAASATDTIKKNAVRKLSDSVAVTDGPSTIRNWSRQFSDSVGTSDSLKRGVVLGRDDTAIVMDILAKAYSTAMSDSVTLSDEDSLQIIKVLEDAAMAEDNFQFALAVREDITLPIALTTRDGMIQLGTKTGTAAPELKTGTIEFKKQNTSVIML